VKIALGGGLRDTYDEGKKCAKKGDLVNINSGPVNCGECGQPIEEDPNLPRDQRRPCPECQSLTRAIGANARTDLCIGQKIGTKQKRPGYKKPILETVSGDDLHRSSGLFNKLSRVIDRLNNRYHERITDPRTGKVVHECAEPLSEHLGHGSEKKAWQARVAVAAYYRWEKNGYVHGHDLDDWLGAEAELKAERLPAKLR
jgi:hypothetical protein